MRSKTSGPELTRPASPFEEESKHQSTIKGLSTKDGLAVLRPRYRGRHAGEDLDIQEIQEVRGTSKEGATAKG